MAYTKSPTQDTHNVVRVPTIGSPVLVSDDSAQLPTTLNFVNCFVKTEKQWGTDPKRVVVKRTPFVPAVCTGSVTTSGVLGGALASAVQLTNVFVAKLAEIYKIDYSTNVVSSVVTTTSAAYGNCTNAIDSTNARRIAWLESPHGSTSLYTFLEDGSSVTTTNLFSINIDGTRGLVFINGYLFAADVDGFKIYNSNPGGVLTTWNSTNFIDAEQYADRIVWLDKHKNYLVAFGDSSTEFFYDNSIEVGSPLARQESYASRIGLRSGSSVGGRRTAAIGDDLYFIGANQSDSLGLYKLSNFQISLVDENQLVAGAMNFINSSGVPGSTSLPIETVIINNNPMVLISLNNDQGLVYDPSENTWFTLLFSSGEFPVYTDRLGVMFFSVLKDSIYRDVRFIGNPILTGTVSIFKPDYLSSTSMTSYMYTEVIDLGNNRYKHLARIDAIGDYNGNTLSLEINSTPNYSQTYSAITPNVVPSTIGYGNNISWYNLGAPRRFSLKFTMTGATPGIHEAFDIEYNMGVA